MFLSLGSNRIRLLTQASPFLLQSLCTHSGMLFSGLFLSLSTSSSSLSLNVTAFLMPFLNVPSTGPPCSCPLTTAFFVALVIICNYFIYMSSLSHTCGLCLVKSYPSSKPQLKVKDAGMFPCPGDSVLAGVTQSANLPYWGRCQMRPLAAQRGSGHWVGV